MVLWDYIGSIRLYKEHMGLYSKGRKTTLGSRKWEYNGMHRFKV